MAGLDITYKGSGKSPGIHSRMPVETPVLETYKAAFVACGDAVAGRETPLAVISDAGTEQLPAPVCDDRRVTDSFKKVPGQAEKVARPENDYSKEEKVFSPQFHLVTSAFAEAVLAAMEGSYMAWQETPGST